MEEADVLERMRSEWDDRAREDAHYYVAFGRRGQGEAEFLATAADVVRSLEGELTRLDPAIAPECRRALEIGCGPGRLMRPLAPRFAEIHGVDVSGEMIRLAARTLQGVPNARVHHTSGADLRPFASESFDFVYSYAVFQHIPSREAVFQYLAEARRVLKNGGLLRCQFNALPHTAGPYTTWEGARHSAEEVAQFARDHDFQLLALEGAGTQYLWTTWRRQPVGWSGRLESPGAVARIRSMGNSHTGEPVVPASGAFACVSILLERLPADCDLNRLEVTLDGKPGAPCYLGPPQRDGVTALNVLLPPGTRTGLVRVEISWLGRPLAPAAWLRVISPGPLAPRVTLASDGINLLSGGRVESGAVKLVMEDCAAPDRFEVWVDDAPAREIEWLATDAVARRYEVNFRLPEGIGPGRHRVLLRSGSGALPPLEIEVA